MGPGDVAGNANFFQFSSSNLRELTIEQFSPHVPRFGHDRVPRLVWLSVVLLGSSLHAMSFYVLISPQTVPANRSRN